MDEKIKLEWLKRLRSGEYPQATGALREINADGEVCGYCCLGVLGTVLEEAGIGKWDGTTFGDPETEMWNEAFLVDRIAKAVGLYHLGNGEQSLQEEVADMNDSGADFITIAHFIEDTV